MASKKTLLGNIKGFQGEPGTSVTVASVSESTADGGSNVVTFSDGKTLTVKNGKNPLYGKKVTFNGDSLCEGANEGSYYGGYGKIIADRNNMTYQNVAHGGGTITAETYTSSGGAKHWICRTIEEMDSTSDYAIIEGGVNDAYAEIPIGVLSEGYDAELDDTTYYGAFESMLKQLVNRFAGKKIGYIAVPKIAPKYDSRNQNVDYYHAALECCEKWGVPVCDLNIGVPPIRYISALSSVYTVDGTHPTEEGYRKYYCDQIESWMKNLTASGKSVVSVVQSHNTDSEAHPDIRGLILALQSGKLNSEGVSIKRALLPLADGTTVEIDVLVASDGTAVIPYTNLVPISIGTDHQIFNNADTPGYKADLRLISSGAEKTLAGSVVTGFIEASSGDVIRISGIDWDISSSSSNYFCCYDENFGFIGGFTSSGSNYGDFLQNTSTYGTYTKSTQGGITEVTFNTLSATTKYVRINAINSNGANIIVTVNEEIT